MNQLELDPALLTTLRTLEQHELEFVLIGEVAQAIYDDGGFATGIQIVPGAYSRNVERLNRALQALDARLASTENLPPGAVDYRNVNLRELAPCTFATAEADIELSFEPDHTGGYRDLFDDAVCIELAPGVSPLIASLQDLGRIAGIEPPEPPPAPAPMALPPEPDLLWWPTDDDDEIHVARGGHVHHEG